MTQLLRMKKRKRRREAVRLLVAYLVIGTLPPLANAYRTTWTHRGCPGGAFGADSVPMRVSASPQPNQYDPLKNQRLGMARKVGSRRTSSRSIRPFAALRRMSLRTFPLHITWIRKLKRLLACLLLSFSISYQLFLPSAQASSPTDLRSFFTTSKETVQPRRNNEYNSNDSNLNDDPMVQKMLEQQQRKAEEDSKRLLAARLETATSPRERRQVERLHFQTEQELEVEKAKGLQKLKRNLLQQGIYVVDPNRMYDIEGHRQVFFYLYGVDLASVPNTPHFKERLKQYTLYSQSMQYQKAPHRQILSYIVQDMQQRGVPDAVEHFQTDKKSRTYERVWRLPFEEAKRLASQYSVNFERYGTIASARVRIANALEEGWNGLSRRAEDDDRIGIYDPTPSRPGQDQEDLSMVSDEGSLGSKIVKRLRRQVPLVAPLVAATSVGFLVLAGGSIAGESYSNQLEKEHKEAVLQDLEQIFGPRSSQSPRKEKVRTQSARGDQETEASTLKGKRVFPTISLFGWKGKSQSQPPEDIGGAHGDIKSRGGSVDAGTETGAGGETPVETNLNVVAEDFRKSSPDLYDLVSVPGPNGMFCRLVSKVLTFGGPQDLFSHVTSLRGEMPFATFDLAAAKSKLGQAISDLDEKTDHDAIINMFDSVVKCMLADLVDLESASLKGGQKSQTTIDGINIIVDFMAHVALVYDAMGELLFEDDIRKATTRSGASSRYDEYGSDRVRALFERVRSTYVLRPS